jgi:hypothetical protein
LGSEVYFAYLYSKNSSADMKKALKATAGSRGRVRAQRDNH